MGGERELRFYPEKIHTLSDQAKRTARRLTDDVEVTVFYSSQEQGRVREMKELLRRFQEENPRIRFRMFDLDRSPRLANEYGVVNYNSAVLEGLGRKLIVRDLGENELTSQLIRLIEGQERIALFTVGHGELDPETATRGRVSRALRRSSRPRTIGSSERATFAPASLRRSRSWSSRGR